MGKSEKNDNRINLFSYPMFWCFFGLCFAVFFAYLIKEDTEFSELENRYLTGRPSISFESIADGTFMDNFETYCNEQIPLRSVLVRGKAALEQLTLKCENDGMSLGNDGFLFEKTLRESSQLSKNISAISNFTKKVSEKERNVYVAIAPTSVYVNEDKLPAGMPHLDEEAFEARLAEAVTEDEYVHIIDLYDALKNHGDEELFYRTDHHWTTLGAGYAYEKIINEMGFDAGDITKYERHDRSDFYGTSFAKFKGFGLRPDTITYYDVPIKEIRLEKSTADSLYDLSKLDTYDKYGMFMHGNDPKIEVISDNSQSKTEGEKSISSGSKAEAKGDENGADMVIFKDSYANCLIPYLVMNFDDIIVVDLRYYGGSVEEILDENKDAKVLLLYNWSFVNEDNHFYKLVK